MNKELILKHPKEFDYYLRGGTVYYKNEGSDRWYYNSDYIWTGNVSTPITAVVIDDEYVEFRKALAEGKTVQYAADEYTPWVDIKEIIPQFILHDSYRIKPDEPQFKAGDCIRYDNNPVQILYTEKANCTDGSYILTLAEGWRVDSRDGTRSRQTINSKDAELWKPQPGEWVIPDTGIDNEIFVVQKFNGHTPLPSRSQPFIGTLPAQLRDLDE